MLTPQQYHLAKVLLCLFLVYLSWGSCFIAIKFCLEGFPAFILCGIRMCLAGSLLYLIAWIHGDRSIPTLKDMKNSFVLALSMVFISGGFLAKGQESISSGTAAMILGAVPIWMVLGGWLFYHEDRPSFRQCIGLMGGFIGLILLSYGQTTTGTDSIWGIVLVLIAALAWVMGSFYSKTHASETQLSVLQTSALLMFLGGVQSLLGALLLGEFARFSPSTLSLTSLFSLVYLVLFGAILGYTCYFWLLMHTRTEVAISYEYVNPVIGVFLGWLLANEQVTMLTVVACCMTVCSVFFVVSPQRKV